MFQSRFLRLVIRLIEEIKKQFLNKKASSSIQFRGFKSRLVSEFGSSFFVKSFFANFTKHPFVN